MRIRRVAAVAAAAILTACALAPVASAENVDLGGTADVDPIDIETEQHWTVGDLMPSTDAIAYQPAGTLWEASVTTTLDNGGVPVISGFSARSDDNTYPVLWQVASPQGIPAGALPPGGSASGKIYFDATGAAPTTVVYAIDGADAFVWD
jgi:hypothetical protein